jgi:hypothetical protein
MEVKPNLTLSIRRKFSYLNTQESTPRPGLPQGEVAPSVQLLSSSFLRKQESSYFNRFWTPAFNGVTDLDFLYDHQLIDNFLSKLMFLVSKKIINNLFY